MFIWDYKLDKNWKPKHQEELEWFLVRKINQGDFEGLKKTVIKENFEKIKKYLDPGKALMLEYFFQKEI